MDISASAPRLSKGFWGISSRQSGHVEGGGRRVRMVVSVPPRVGTNAEATGTDPRAQVTATGHYLG